METFSALLAFCAGNPPVPGEFTSQRPATWSFDIFFDLCLNKCLSKQSWGWLFESPSCSLWRHSASYRSRENLDFVSIVTVQFMICEDNWVHYHLKVVFVYSHITLHYHHHADSKHWTYSEIQYKLASCFWYPTFRWWSVWSYQRMQLFVK